ncbi:signal peptide peptidase SppA [Cesiribacter sp. SM1]|uniref:signal peptide peptidase SppA n=1 Tax=Cesiribacter sp. SM1 TaxID=2861196 RepID=UPI001CD7FB01|nr:signal peptide peptidase SppA [Cesiribacter sp. SM1]
MLQFLKAIAATIVGLILFSVLLLVIGGGIIGAIASHDQEVEVKENTVLHLKLDKPIVERANEDDMSALDAIPGISAGNIGLIEVIESIKHAKDDDNIKGILLQPQYVTSGYASLKEIRDELLRFRESGKWVIAYNEQYTEKDYYLASAASKIYLNPAGNLELNGLVSEQVFVKGTLDKVGIEPQIFRVGEFKSAVEPLMRTEMSEASREQTNSFLNNIYLTFLQEVGQSRGIEVNELERISDEMLVRRADDALKYKIVDELGYLDQIHSEIRNMLGIEDETEKINTISYSKYRKSFNALGSGSNRVAVIVAAGDIVSGSGDRESIGSDKFAKLIRDARLNDRVKAVVLRINSPGGSALASDVIWREIVLTSQTKPIIASMSDMAASGGYYMAMGCDTIVAQPNTITGSIGIFGVLFNAQEFMTEKLGITTDVVQTGELSNLYRVTKPLSAYERSIIQQSVEEGYEEFTRKAAEGRNMSVEQLREVASGRVWSGLEAKDRGLVDVLGGLDEAINIAVAKAGLEEGDYRLRYYPEKKSFIEELFGGLEEDMATKALQREFGVFYPYVKQFQRLQRFEGVQARLPYELIIE